MAHSIARQTALDAMPDTLATSSILKVDTSHGVVFGFAIICKEKGEDHYDLQEHHIPEDVMLSAAVDFAAADRVAKDMHAGDETGKVLFIFPLTTDIAKSFGFETERTGLMIGMKPDNPETLAKFASGEYRGFSIGGGGKLVDAPEAA